MIPTQQDTTFEGNLKTDFIDLYNFEELPSGGTERNFFRDFSSTQKHEETQWGLDEKYRLPVTGEADISDKVPVNKIVPLLNDAINLIDEVLEVYEDEIERLNTFSLIEEKIKSLWEVHTDANDNFAEVLVLIEVAVKNSHYQDYRENHYKAIKAVLEKIKEVFITPQRAKECRKIFMENGINLYAPFINWEDYTIEIKKKNAGE